MNEAERLEAESENEWMETLQLTRTEAILRKHITVELSANVFFISCTNITTAIVVRSSVSRIICSILYGSAACIRDVFIVRPIRRRNLLYIG